MQRTGLAWLAAAAMAVSMLSGCATLAPPAEPLPGFAEPDVAPVAPETAPPVPALPPVTVPAPQAILPAPHWATRTDLPGNQDPARTDLWVRVRAGFAVPDLDDDLVRKWEAHYAARPDYFARMTERGGRYLFHIVEEVQARGLPMELALLPFIESAFNPQALSSARAAGMWQFMPATGRAFDLKQNLFRDDRRDVLASTAAALDYLQMLHGMFDDWHLALAAYNWGQGSVQRAMRRQAQYGRPTDYRSLRMPAETRNYVPKLQAIKNIVAAPERFGLNLPPLENHPFFLSVPITRDLDVALAAQLAGLPLETFQQFNPQMNKPVILAAGTPQILLPYDNANRFVRALQNHTGPLSSWTAWVAPRTLKPADAARLTGTTESDLRATNRIPPNMLVRVGSTLLVPRAAHTTEDVPLDLADNAALQLSPEGGHVKRVVLKVGKQGDTVALVARRYKLKADDVARWNDVGLKHRFRAGSRVVVMMPVKAASATRKKPPTKASTSPAKQKVVKKR